MFLVDTKCGKTMKRFLYKYHQKKCDICKDKKSLGINVEEVSRMCKQNRGKTFDELSLKDWKSSAPKGDRKNKNELLDLVREGKNRKKN